jgi:hypothetical protein
MILPPIALFLRSHFKSRYAVNQIDVISRLSYVQLAISVSFIGQADLSG